MIDDPCWRNRQHSESAAVIPTEPRVCGVLFITILTQVALVQAAHWTLAERDVQAPLGSAVAVSATAPYDGPVKNVTEEARQRLRFWRCSRGRKCRLKKK